jgi:hypothetical protein
MDLNPMFSKANIRKVITFLTAIAPEPHFTKLLSDLNNKYGYLLPIKHTFLENATFRALPELGKMGMVHFQLY